MIRDFLVLYFFLGNWCFIKQVTSGCDCSMHLYYLSSGKRTCNYVVVSDVETPLRLKHSNIFTVVLLWYVLCFNMRHSVILLAILLDCIIWIDLLHHYIFHEKTRVCFGSLPTFIFLLN